MTRPNYPTHLQSNSFYGKEFTACGLYNATAVPWRSVKRVACKNCLKIIEANTKTKFYEPRKQIMKEEVRGE